ncbi:hypothetical protein NPX79_00040 [Spiroplasma endosymbiont of Anurida maritima]|uniref:DxFTY motif-containing membrane protein n=1 Tax=Spiroplasma endosymbiont of Anurida maritima TaxID=2967972 RepID=UPI0036D3D883
MKNKEEYLKNYIEENDDFNKQRTPFWKSIIFLFLEAILPFVALYITTSNDIALIKNYGVGASIGFAFLLIFLTTALTILFVFFNFHKEDQITYVFATICTLVLFYTTSFWLSLDQLIYRALISILGLIITALIGSILSNLIRNFRLKKSDIPN